MDDTQTKFICKCGKFESWLSDGQVTKEPCPNCGRMYEGKYNRKKYTIEVKEIQNENNCNNTE